MAGSAEEDVTRVRGAVASFNAKMLDKYGDNDENIPESGEYTPRTPSSPAYSSMFQEGGGGSMRLNRSSNKFIPQIPTGVLESYLSSRYGAAATTSAAATAATTGGLMTGGSSVGLGIPTMNIPVVATMPMAGMMPIQQQPQAGGAPLQQSQQSSGSGGAAQAAAQTGGGGGPAPNAEGVKTLSIKI